MSALSDLVKYAQMGDVRYVRGEHNERYSRVNQAAVELAELQAIKEAAWKLIEHPTSEAKLQALARVLGVEL